MTKYGGRMTNCGYRFPGCVHGLDQCNGVAVFRQIPQWTMPARVKHGIVFLWRNIRKFQGVRQCGLCIFVVFEAFG